MRDWIGRKLAPLASLAAQRRFILDATADAYYLPEEILENAAEAVRLGENLGNSRAEAKAELAELGRLLRDYELPMASPDLVEADPGWAALRSAARRVLVALGFDLASWEALELRCGDAG